MLPSQITANNWESRLLFKGGARFVMKKEVRKVPTLRFHEFEKDWAISIMADHTESSAFGPRFSSDLYSTSGQIATLRTTDIDEDGNLDIDSAPLALLDELEFENHLLHKDDLVISRSGTVGITGIFEGYHLPVLPGAFLIRFRLKKTSISPLFTKLYFNSFQGQKKLLGLAAGGVQKNLKGSSILKMSLCFPTLPEQQKIASFFSTVDKKIEQLTRKKELLEQYKKGVMQKIFSQEIRFKDDNGQDYPNWKKKEFQDIVVKGKGAMKIGPFGSQLKKETFVVEGYKVYGQENVFLKDFNFGDRYISIEHFDNLKSNELQSGDYVISTMGTIGKSCIVPDNIQKGIMDSHIIRLRLNNKSIYPHFLSQLFLTHDLLKQIKRLSVGGIMDGLSMGIIKELKFPLPSLDEQKKIANLLSSIDDKINTVKTQLTQIQNFKKGLLQKMFV